MTESIKAITDFLFIEDNIEEIKRSDLLIVLCNNMMSDMANKIDYLFKNNKIDSDTKIILSGAKGPLDIDEEKECIRLLEILNRDYGYEKSLFVLEEDATNIYENLLYSKRYLDSFNKYNNIILMGSAFALRRVKMCASHLGYPINKINYVGTVGIRNVSKEDWYKSEMAKERVFGELERIGKYLSKGDLDIN